LRNFYTTLLTEQLEREAEAVSGDGNKQTLNEETASKVNPNF